MDDSLARLAVGRAEFALAGARDLQPFLAAEGNSHAAGSSWHCAGLSRFRGGDRRRAGRGLAVQRMPVDIFPNLGAPAIYVAQPYGGMDPSQMEGFS